MRKFLLLSLFAGISVLIWQLSEPLVAQAPPAQSPREKFLSSVREQLINDGNPQQEVDQKIAVGNQVWNTADARGLNPQTTANLVGTIIEKPIQFLNPIASATEQMINNTDFSNLPVDPFTQGAIITNMAAGQISGLAPDRVQEISNTLVQVANDPKFPKDSVATANMLLGSVANGIIDGQSPDQAKQRFDAVLAVQQQLSGQGLSNTQVGEGVLAAVNSLNGGATNPEQLLQAANVTINSIGSGATQVATTASQPAITNAVLAGGDVEAVASAAIPIAQQTIENQESTVAGMVAGTTTGNAVLQGIPVEQANQRGLQAGEMTGQLVQQFGDLSAAVAGPTITDGFVNGQNEQLINNAAQLSATQAQVIENDGGNLTTIGIGANIAGQTMLTTQDENLSIDASNVGVLAAQNQLDNNGGTLSATTAADTAAQTSLQFGGDPTEQEPTQDGTDEPPQDDQQEPPVGDPNAPPPDFQQEPPPTE